MGPILSGLPLLLASLKKHNSRLRFYLYSTNYTIDETQRAPYHGHTSRPSPHSTSRPSPVLDGPSDAPLDKIR